MEKIKKKVLVLGSSGMLGHVLTDFLKNDNSFTVYNLSKEKKYLWNHHSYEAVLYGMDFLREECESWFGSNRPPPAVNRQVLDAMEKAQKHLPPHDIWLRKVVNMGEYSSI